MTMPGKSSSAHDAASDQQLDADVAESSSPVCSMHEADDAYMGYAGNDELIAALRTLVALTDKDQWRDMLSSHALALASLSTAEHEAPGPANPNEHRAEVVKTLKSILPRVRNDRLHADLAGMLRDYETPLPG